MTTQQIVSRELAFKRNLKKVKFICIKFRNEVLRSTEIYQHIYIYIYIQYTVYEFISVLLITL